VIADLHLIKAAPEASRTSDYTRMLWMQSEVRVKFLGVTVRCV